MAMANGVRFLFYIVLLLLLLVSLCCADEKQQQQQLASAMLVGTVFCDTCFHQEFSKSSHFIQGASVAVECGNGGAKPTFRKEVRTNRHGVFRVRLPAQVGRHVNTVKACSVKLVRSSEPFCAVASSATSAGLRLKSRRNGVRVFSAGFFTFKPLKQPELCYQEPKPATSVEDQKIGPGFFFPPIPFVPSPPNIGGVPLPPNPLTPPPALLPPNPLQPPPAPFVGIPPLPFLTPPPPPPSLFPPSFPFPRIPGIPPSSTSKANSP